MLLSNGERIQERGLAPLKLPKSQRSQRLKVFVRPVNKFFKVYS